jgi:cytochrome c oxidase subunit 3
VRATRAVADVSALPRTVFGHRSLMWWGTLGFIVIEGTTLFISAVSYFYLRRNYSTWPPEHIFRPALLIPTIQVTLMLASNVPMWLADRASRRMDLATVRKWFLVCSALALVMTILRWFEFEALNVRWDTSAYGSVVWAALTVHTTLLLLELAETVALTMLLYGNEVEDRDLSGASDDAFYWYFLTGAWVPLYVMVFLSPYFM